MDLAVRRLARARGRTSVLNGRAGSWTGLEHPGHDRGVAGARRPARPPSANGPSSGLGEAAHVRAGLAEVAREHLGEHDQVGARRRQVGDRGPVVGRVEGGGVLDEGHPQLVGHPPSLPPGRHRWEDPPAVQQFAAVVLTGGTGARLGGRRQGHPRVRRPDAPGPRPRRGRPDADEVVVVGAPDARPPRPVRFTREDPPSGRPGGRAARRRDASSPAPPTSWSCSPSTCRWSRRGHGRPAAGRAAPGTTAPSWWTTRGRRQLAGVLDVGPAATAAARADGRPARTAAAPAAGRPRPGRRRRPAGRGARRRHLGRPARPAGSHR